MRLIYNDALNKRIAPYLERLTKKRTGLDKETMTLLDVFMQYFNMDTRYGTYSDKLEPCIIHIIQEEDKECCQSFRRKVEQSAPLSIGRRICQPVSHLSETQSTVSVHSWIFAPVTAVGKSPSAFQSHHRCADGISKTTCHRIQRTSHTERRKHSGRNRNIQGCDELPKLDGRPNSRRQPDCH